MDEGALIYAKGCRRLAPLMLGTHGRLWTQLLYILPHARAYVVKTRKRPEASTRSPIVLALFVVVILKPDSEPRSLPTPTTSLPHVVEAAIPESKPKGPLAQ